MDIKWFIGSMAIKSHEITTLNVIITCKSWNLNCFVDGLYGLIRKWISIRALSPSCVIS